MGLGNKILLFHKWLYHSTPPLLQIVFIEVLDSLLLSYFRGDGFSQLLPLMLYWSSSGV